MQQRAAKRGSRVKKFKESQRCSVTWRDCPRPTITTRMHNDMNEPPADELDAFYAPVGRVVVAFGNLEFSVMNLLIGILHGEPNRSLVVVCEMSLAKRIDAARSLAKYFPKDHSALAQKLNTLLIEASQLAQERDAVIHSAWVIKKGPGQVARLKATAKGKAGFKAHFTTVTGAELNALADRLKANWSAIARLQTELHGVGLSVCKIE
jgi:hypothetical protein